jgi:LAO/AO transport system kinase
MREAPAHHGVELRVQNPARAAREAAAGPQQASWVPPVVKTVAVTGDGIPDFVAALDRHAEYLAGSGELRRRRLRRLREQVVEVAEQRLRRRLWNDPGIREFIDSVVPLIEQGAATPWGVVDEVLRRGAGVIARTES